MTNQEKLRRQKQKEAKLDIRQMAIADTIKRLRKQKGYVSYDYFAWENKIPRVQYWRMEIGTNFSMKSLLRVLDAHDISLKEFFEEVDKDLKKIEKEEKV